MFLYKTFLFTFKLSQNFAVIIGCTNILLNKIIICDWWRSHINPKGHIILLTIV